jgi:hypothetical protein
MKRLAVALVAGAAVSTVAYASASALAVDGGTIQAGADTTLSCDDEVKVNWGLETDTNSVDNVRISDVAAACVGTEMFVKINNGTTHRATVEGSEVTVSFPAMAPESIENVKVWIEG